MRAVVLESYGETDVLAVTEVPDPVAGPEEVLVGAKVALAPGLDMVAVAAAIDDAERRVREAEPLAKVIYVEPDLYRAHLASGARATPGAGATAT